ncbi:MBL fold metallo-hydrolase [Deminuibacter soli]|uniref:MBL fold metallo-hydrolase n=1 Tax=Deminuibacter soli TaxID=2291815 RepID=A0A3E1NPG2_9BACT|nr:MBL fold metallo-hydrolase [Deminuibacter soli]RFM29800.1 MBL fold metallo-hydrolase [Deminuibacter soli]
MKLYSIDTELFKLDGGAMFGVVPKTIWNKLNPADENNMCTWAMRLLLIEDGKRLILVDTGIGNKQDEKFFSHYYLHGNATLHSSLAKHGFTEDDITDVILTHLHFDHCGGAVTRNGEKLEPVFKNAVYWSNERHWNAAIAPNAREKASFLKENILPIQQSGQLQFIAPLPNAPAGHAIDMPVPFSDNISLLFAQGHTESMMLPVLQYKGHTIVYMADLLPSIAHLPLPYVMAYDMRPETTLTEKEIFLDKAIAGNYILFFEHDAQYECCTLEQGDKGRIKPKNIFTLSEL